MFLVFGPPGMWDIAPQQEIEPTPALEGKVLTAGPPGNSPRGCCLGLTAPPQLHQIQLDKKLLAGPRHAQLSQGTPPFHLTRAAPRSRAARRDAEAEKEGRCSPGVHSGAGRSLLWAGLVSVTRFVAGVLRLKPYPGHREPFLTLSAQDSVLPCESRETDSPKPSGNTSPLSVFFPWCLQFKPL